MDYHFLIVDDDHASLSMVSGLIKQLLPGASIDMAETVKAAMPLLARENFDVLFLATGMEGQASFRLLNGVKHRNFELVFLSDDPESAFDAIKEGAADYLLKPLKKAAFRDALQKVIERRSRYLAYSEAPQGPNAYLFQKISIPHQQGLWFITLNDIIYLKADNSYTTIYTTQGEKITTSKPISRFELVLDNPWFFRIHKSYLINTSQFKAYESRSGDAAIMSNGDKLLISRYRLSRFLEVMKEVSGALKI